MSFRVTVPCTRAQGEAIAEAFDDLRNLDADGIRRQRRQKFLDIGRKLG